MAKQLRLICALSLLLIITAFSVHAGNKTVRYYYDDAGQIIKVEYDSGTSIDYVFDGSGNRIAETVTSGMYMNNPPAEPYGPSPADGSADISIYADLSWTAPGDPDPDDMVYYDIFIGTDELNMVSVKRGFAETGLSLVLDPETTYYWKITARDNHNELSEGPVWSFTTETPPADTLTADFTHDPANAYEPALVYFTDASSSYGGTIVSREWDFDGDGTTDATDQSPSFEYTKDGIYNVVLTVTDDSGMRDTAASLITIYDTSPAAGFTAAPLSGAAPLTVCFSNSSTAYDEPMTFQWDFDNDGSVDSVSSEPCHDYNNSGTYSVNLTVTDSDGSSGSLIITDYITAECPTLPARIAGGDYFPSLREAYYAAQDGDTIQARSVTFTENLYIKRYKSVTISGGYNCDYSYIEGSTILKGYIRAYSGIVSIDNFILE